MIKRFPVNSQSGLGAQKILVREKYNTLPDEEKLAKVQIWAAQGPNLVPLDNNAVFAKVSGPMPALFQLRLL